MKKLFFIFTLLLTLTAVTACTTFKAETPAQRYFALKHDYSQILKVAVAYKRNCEAKALPTWCKAHVEKIRSINSRVYDTMKQADLFVEAGESTNLAVTVASLNTAVAELSKYIISIEGE